MPQNEYMEEHRKKYGRRMDHEERTRKKEARSAHKRAEFESKVHGLRAKLYHKKRHAEKVQMKKTIKMHEEKDSKHKEGDTVKDGAVPAYLLDRQEVSRAKILSNSVKQKRKERAGRYVVPLPKVTPISEAEMFKVIKTGKRQKKSWKRMVTKVTFVGDGFTRKPPKYERFIRPMALRFKRANVTHPDSRVLFN